MGTPARHRSSDTRPSRLRYVTDPVAEALAAFGVTVANKRGRGGDEEDQLRGPLEELLRLLGQQLGVRAVAYGEVRLKAIHARPDYAVDVGGTRVGYVELKAPGRGVPTTWRRPDIHERRQWEKLKALPNVLYTDGLTWARYTYGDLSGSVVRLKGGLDDARRPLKAGPEFEALVRDFLLWDPEQPRTLGQVIKIVAGLCRLLRDEVSAVLADPSRAVAHEELTLLAADWRDLLFPDLDDVGFADAYAQTVTFALLLARVDGVSFGATSLHEIARLLGKKHSLMGRALSVLTDSDATDELRTIETLRRVIGCVDWGALDTRHPDVHADLYERFLSIYDPALRRRSGSYYTPQGVAEAMVNFVDEVLRERFDRSWALAADDVVLVDPAMGTGTFLVEVLRAVAQTIDARQGKGARGPRLRRFFQDQLVGFEIQAAPYAVAELRLHQAMKTQFKTELPASEVRFLTDALEDPDKQQGRLRAGYRIIEQAHQKANRIKRDLPVMVVIGNPPHVENTKGRAPWIEARRKVPQQPDGPTSRPSLDEFRVPGGSRYESDLYGLTWCYWRWALWKVFEAHPTQSQGIVAFVTPASFIKGKSFEGMREYLRRICDEGWIIELSPEGNRPRQETRLFGSEVGRQLCIAIFTRYGRGRTESPATVHRISLFGESAEKLARLRSLHLPDPEWATCRSRWREPFLTGGDTAWELHPSLKDIFPESSRGVTTGRTWIYGPDTETLHRRWDKFIHSSKTIRRKLLHESRDRTIDTVVDPLPGFPHPEATLATETGPPLAPIRVAYRSFDRQWILPDSRLMVMPRRPLWAIRKSPGQIYLTEQSNHPIESGPGLTFTNLIPDIHHYNNRSGRVFPLYCDDAAQIPNLTPGLCDFLKEILGCQPKASELLAYVAGVVAHGGYTQAFKTQLEHPGIRVPLTRDWNLWREAVAIGYEVLWLHTFGQFTADMNSHRSFSDFVCAAGPKVITEIPDAAGDLPDKIDYDDETQILIVGSGRIGPVTRRVWDYDVGGMRIVRHWFNYRSAHQRYQRRSSPLDDETIHSWSSDLTDELLEILTVLHACVKLEPRQQGLLKRICDGDLVSTTDLEDANVLPALNVSKISASIKRHQSPLF